MWKMQDLEEKYENYQIKMKEEFRRKQLEALPKVDKEAMKKDAFKINN